MGSNTRYSNLGAYGNDIKNFKLLSPEKEKKLCEEMVNGNIKSRNELITSNLGLVIKQAMKYRNMGLELQELICEGNKGLIIAANRFNPKMDNRFSTYAHAWIKQSILSAIEENRIWSSTSANNVMNYEDYYSEKELSVNMNEFECDDDNQYKDIMRRMDGLPNRDRSIVKHYFGVSGYSELNTIELSEKFNISTMRVSNIIENSIRKIRCDILENI